MSWGSLRFSGIRQCLPGSGLAPIWIDSGAQTPPWEPWTARRCLREALPLFLQEAPGSSLEGFDVIDVDEATPDLDDPLVLQASESPRHRLPVGTDHGAQVLVGVAGRYADLSGDLHPLALDEEEDEASEP